MIADAHDNKGCYEDAMKRLMVGVSKSASAGLQL